MVLEHFKVAMLWQKHSYAERQGKYGKIRILRPKRLPAPSVRHARRSGHFWPPQPIPTHGRNIRSQRRVVRRPNSASQLLLFRLTGKSTHVSLFSCFVVQLCFYGICPNKRHGIPTLLFRPFLTPLHQTGRRRRNTDYAPCGAPPSASVAERT